MGNSSTHTIFTMTSFGHIDEFLPTKGDWRLSFQGKLNTGLKKTGWGPSFSLRGRHIPFTERSGHAIV